MSNLAVTYSPVAAQLGAAQPALGQDAQFATDTGFAGILSDRGAATDAIMLHASMGLVQSAPQATAFDKAALFGVATYFSNWAFSEQRYHLPPPSQRETGSSIQDADNIDTLLERPVATVAVSEGRDTPYDGKWSFHSHGGWIQEGSPTTAMGGGRSRGEAALPLRPILGGVSAPVTAIWFPVSSERSAQNTPITKAAEAFSRAGPGTPQALSVRAQAVAALSPINLAAWLDGDRVMVAVRVGSVTEAEENRLAAALGETILADGHRPYIVMNGIPAGSSRT
jgi:hypothetical protein